MNYRIHWSYFFTAPYEPRPCRQGVVINIEPETVILVTMKILALLSTVTKKRLL